MPAAQSAQEAAGTSQAATQRLQSWGAAWLSPNAGLGETPRCWVLGLLGGIRLKQCQRRKAQPGSVAPRGKGRVRIRHGDARGSRW